MDQYAIEVIQVTKSFGGIHALKSINLQIRTGSIHAIIGENGAGKSTLMKILSGIYTKDSGRIMIHGEEKNFTSPIHSKENRIGIIYQELALSPDLTVAENIFLDDLGFGTGMINWKRLNEKASLILNELGFQIDPRARVGDLSVAYQQMVEIAKSLAKDVNILILDEPSAVLSGKEVAILFTQLRKLKERGVTIIYISHRLEELMVIADVITVIKDGETVTTLDPQSCSEDEIITSMVGRKLESLYPEKNVPGNEVVLEVKALSTRALLHDINLTLHKGEIVGLAGLVGAGRSEVARCLFGIDKIAGGTVFKAGTPIQINHPSQAMSHGIGLVPESRKEQGAILVRPIRENMTLSNLKAVSGWMGFIRRRQERETSQKLQQKLAIKLGSVEDPIASLSGGNQQKVVIAKWLNTDCHILILDEPTRGVDVGAKAEIYNIIHQLAERGYSILVISSEMVEVINLCHRIYVMSEGRITKELQHNDISEENIMRYAIPKRETILNRDNIT
ncbi:MULTISPECIES: sugar ABC transporter ATP-binding protein [Yersinia pseudotuberculosis complex]|uniref:Sugar transport ATP-binding protein n=1 Tax=Yersinia wautersii TaxID=1341643 RepID=A0ABM9TKN8_9GAMM|nr:MULTISPECIES: sugar ABC transporter ATP-binding protein [Yersinia pseudotuberculosis complex]CND06422.1 putative sugar transport ATP-binding protein [Yersinia pseudotuberculosis]CRG52630.1 putative sugar transport ATP-binding protein [Yersinia wautersii]CRY72135.1 putative sugar transport ATP-binding protein [Yersinia pseudotuberculosis]